jgi:hypothetical protein
VLGELVVGELVPVGAAVARVGPVARSAAVLGELMPAGVELVPSGELVVAGLVPVGELAELVVVGRCRARRAGGG